VRVLLPDDEEIVFAASGGILEVMPHMVTVLADMAERADHLDAAAATRAKEQAERLLASRTDEMDIEKAQEKLDEAIAQLQALERLRRMTQRKH
jgi:F-type H+-transporting ATPase subunit epsilon